MDDGLNEVCLDDGGGWSFASMPARNARDRIMSAASHLFCNHGFAATGIDAILDRAGTAKATLYHHFRSKEELISAVLQAEGDTWRDWFFGRLSQVEGPARNRVLAVFDVLEDWFADPGFYGCPFINAVAEFDTGNDAVRQAAERHKDHLLTWLKAQMMEMKVSDVVETTRSIAILIDGAIVAAQHSGDPSFARTARRLAECHLDTVLGRAG
ncbi:MULTISPECIES: TetR/AcrR family transcriptional regulator [Mameliella]|uniref:TetR/AcrR family transcriptional regulator n=1 Tax=Mameliella TaxID=1434019 RepID=UPI00088F30BB|nr:MULTISPECIES: TetR/AcrR family transcriptional regulator [Mameliella]MBV6637223.1 TetR/AcrR family transcriptional regulator [Mameliella sp.]MCR9272351.1 TetR/AcrR family transcriptional regulator [Paracoccaceae bacterium]MBY6117660.1 TetR/AcrR family transcriptional regulator [Mameliella alba]OWV44548.1 TetR/AcrR family transcriptional regulator [Mameliella alba]OWV48693.1 TetR/AcrR family transcriptional regulator [Mameliella alba]